MDDAPASAEDIPSDAPKPGDVLQGEYRIGRVLGVGGVGLVLAAERISSGEQVAIKMLLPEHTRNAQVVERFLREGRIAQRIESPHCTRVFEVGTAEDGTPFLVMEYLTGVDLDKVLETRGAQPYMQVVDWVVEACEGIAEAHKIKTVHRDLKPANLFLAKIGKKEIVKVLDFGISKSIALGNASLQMTRTATLLGSPYYMSPEQFKSSRDVDERTDIWSLGVIIFELLSGARPFEAPSLAELSVKVLMADAPLLMAPTIPPGLANVVATCLQKDPGLRFTNLADFADAIAIHGSPKARASAQRIVATLGMPAERASTRRTVTALADTSPVAKGAPAPAGSLPPPAGSLPPPAGSLPPPAGSLPPPPMQSSPDLLARSNGGLSRTLAGPAWHSTGMALAVTVVVAALGVMIIVIAIGRRKHDAPTAETRSVEPASQPAPETSAVVAPSSSVADTKQDPPSDEAARAQAAASASAGRDAGPPGARGTPRRRARGTGMFGTEN